MASRGHSSGSTGVMRRGCTTVTVRRVVLPLLLGLLYVYSLLFSYDAVYFTVQNARQIQTNSTVLSTSLENSSNEKNDLYLQSDGNTAEIFDDTKQESLELLRSLENLKSVNALYTYNDYLKYGSGSSISHLNQTSKDDEKESQILKNNQQDKEKDKIDLIPDSKDIPKNLINKVDTIKSIKSNTDTKLSTESKQITQEATETTNPLIILFFTLLWFRITLAFIVRFLTEADTNEPNYWEWEVSDMGEIRRRRRRPTQQQSTNPSSQAQSSSETLSWREFILSSIRPSSFNIRNLFTIQSTATTSAERRRQRQRLQQEQFQDLVNQLNTTRISNGAGPLSEDAIRALIMRQTTMNTSIIGGFPVTINIGTRNNDDFSPEDYDMLWNFQEENGHALQSSALVENNGMSKEEIDRLPTRVLKPGDDLIAATTTSNNPPPGSIGSGKYSDMDGDRTKCSICLEDFQCGDVVTTLPCFHSFHKVCINRWLASKSICPICKHSAIC